MLCVVVAYESSTARTGILHEYSVTNAFNCLVGSFDYTYSIVCVRIVYMHTSHLRITTFFLTDRFSSLFGGARKSLALEHIDQRPPAFFILTFVAFSASM